MINKGKLMLILLYMFLFLASCSQTVQSEMSYADDVMISQTGIFYESEETIPDIYDYVQGFTGRLGNIYFFTKNINKFDNKRLTSYSIYKMGADLIPQLIASIESDVIHFEYILPNDSGEIYIIEKNILDKTYRIQLVDNLNCIIDLEDINNSCLTDVFSNRTSFDFNIFANDKGFIVASADELKYYDSKFNYVKSVKINGHIIDSCMLCDDIIYVCYKKQSGSICISRYDNEGVEQKTVGVRDDAVMYIIEGESKNKIFIIERECIKELDFTDETLQMVCDLKKSNINPEQTIDLYVPDSHRILIYDNNEEDNGSLKIFNDQISTENDKTILTLMGETCSPELRNAVRDYNNTHSDTNIEILEYDHYINPEERMLTDITAGYIPDMYILDENGFAGMSFMTCIDDNMFENVRYFLLNDSDIHETDFNNNIYSKMLYNEGLYFTGSFVNLLTIAADGRELQNINSYDTLKLYADKKNPEAKIFLVDSKMDQLTEFMKLDMDSFIDIENKTCCFENQEFQTMLELCNRGDYFEGDIDEDTMQNQFRDGKALCMKINVSIDEIQLVKETFGNDSFLFGYPGKGTVITFSGMIAMSTSCKDKDAAWEFMKMFMTDDYISDSYMNYSEGRIPIRNDGIDAYIDLYRHLDGYDDLFGNYISMGRIGSGLYKYGESVVIHKISEDEEKIFYEIINNTNGFYGCDEHIMRIITEEAKDYFNGDKSEADIESVIQNRIQTLLNETE